MQYQSHYKTQHPILLIEDDKDIRETLTEFLDGEGYPVVSVRHGLEALEWLQDARHQTSLILLDMMMPVMNGRQFLETLRADHQQILRVTPIMIFSAGADAQSLAEEFGAGVVQKLDLEGLLEVAERHCTFTKRSVV